jgi:hypothetical protein
MTWLRTAFQHAKRSGYTPVRKPIWRSSLTNICALMRSWWIKVMLSISVPMHWLIC